MSMVSIDTSFDAPDFAVPARPVWYIRKPGWIRGPYSLEDMQRFRDLGWLSKAEAVSRDMQAWEPAGQVAELWMGREAAPQPAEPERPTAGPVSNAVWRYTLDHQPCDEPVSFATLQVLASLGRIRGRDMVWREGWPEWKKADGVPGLLHGPAQWCSACGGEVAPRDPRCRWCGAALPGSAASHAELCMTCGVLGMVMFPIFPLWLIAIALGSYDKAEIAKGRMDPRGRNAAQFGLYAGIVGGGLFILSALIGLCMLVVGR
jgi:hypothetical protein